MNTLLQTNFVFSGQQKVYKGKVRDVYFLDPDRVVMIATDRLSAFDVVMPRGIPYKGQVLNQIAAYMLKNTQDLVPNWLIATPDPNVAIGKACQPIKLEMVIRGYLSGHAARLYNEGIRTICGVRLPDGMKESDPFVRPIITPATKAKEGTHDEDVSKEEAIAKGIVSKKTYEIIEHYTKILFERGTKIADQKGLILVDTKYEFGITEDGTVLLIDEIHTPDSSRYFYKSGYEERQRQGIPQRQLSKEFVRQWLIKKGFQGLEGQKLPDLSDGIIHSISERYIDLYETIVAAPFAKQTTTNIEERIYDRVSDYLELV